MAEARTAVTTFRSNNPNFTWDSWLEEVREPRRSDLQPHETDFEAIRGRSQGVNILMGKACQILKDLVDWRFRDLGHNQVDEIVAFLVFLDPSDEISKQSITGQNKLSEALKGPHYIEDRNQQSFRRLHPTVQK